ncbi:MAG: CoA transferase, partial [Candidatus Methylomirabilia bacterium]
MAHREALKRRLNERFTARTQIEWIEKLMAAGIPAGPIYTLDQVFADPQVQHSRLVEEVAHPLLGSIRQLSNPIRLDALEGRTVRQPPPLLGEHTEAVLKDFGFSAERIAGLLAREVVKLGPRESR